MDVGRLGLLAAALVAGGAGAFDGPDREALVEAHNRWRAEVGSPPLAWSADLAATASWWAENLKARRGCRMEHSPGPAGENLYWASPWRYADGRRRVQDVAAAQPVDRWAKEKADYDREGGRCAAGRQCGHYTQVVWRETREVGCGKAVCDDGSQVWVCHYRPAGNIVGRRPY